MNQQLTATCQCIIAHPSKPKFLAIRHSNGYLPPQIMVPEDAVLGTHVQQVLDGIHNKYGIRATLLRHLARFRDYHCLELEMRGKDGRKMEAIWVGLDDYRRMRGTGSSGFDPLRNWLQQQEAGVASPLRPSWEQIGWFDRAVHWIQFQLDRLHIQTTGSVVQHRVFQHSATVLRVPSASGQLYFKAAYAREPTEVRLNSLLQQHWPDMSPRMLAEDQERNWMLFPDYAPGSEKPVGVDGLCRAAEAMGRLQLESIEITEALRMAGCRTQGMGELAAFLAQDDLQRLLPEIAEDGLSAEERRELDLTARELADTCGALADCGIPDTLVHPDFRAPNFFVTADSVRVIDWADACIAPPFFTLLELMREDRPMAFAKPLEDPVVRAWLGPLEASFDGVALQRGLGLAICLQHAWRLKRWIEEFAWLEPGSVAEMNAWRFATGLARRLIAAARQGSPDRPQRGVSGSSG